MQKLLEEQIERMRQLNERLTQLRRGITETNQAVALSRTIKPRGPLFDVRDYRTLESHEYGTSEAAARPPSRSVGTAADSSRKRRRR